MTEFSKMQRLKRRFFAMRNGITADALRRAGQPFRVIFGLNMPQLREIAGEFGPDEELARELWANRSTRESMLLAPMLIKPDGFSDGLLWLSESPTPEVTDILCHSLLRHLPDAEKIACEAAASTDAMTRYGAIRLAYNLLNSGNKAAAISIAEGLAADPDKRVSTTAARLIDDASYL